MKNLAKYKLFLCFPKVLISSRDVGSLFKVVQHRFANVSSRIKSNRNQSFTVPATLQLISIPKLKTLADAFRL